STEDTSDSETVSRPRTPPGEQPDERRTNEPQTPSVTRNMAAKPMKPSGFNGKTRDAQAVDAWLARMTIYLELTDTAEKDKVKFASTYLEGDAYDWLAGNYTALLAGTFDNFKTSLRDHFVPQNYKSVAYKQYKALKQGTLSVSEYSSKIKALADQIPDLISNFSRDLDFVEGLFPDIRKFIVSQSPVKDETWNALVGRALRIEEALPPGYQLTSNRPTPNQPTSNRSTSMSSGPRRGPSQFSRSEGSSNSDRSSNWRQKPTDMPASPPVKGLEPLTDAARDFLRKHEGCFRCRRTYAGHTQFDPECPLNGGATKVTVKNSGLVKGVKQETNFVNEVKEYQYDQSEECYVIPLIILSIQLDDQISAQGLVDCDFSSDLISEKIVNRNLSSLRSRFTSSSALLHNALSHKTVRIFKELFTKLQFLSSVEAKIKSLTILKVASLASHDVILEMSFLERNNLLIDSVARTVILRAIDSVVFKLSSSIAEQDHYVKVDNALMQVSETTVRILCRHAADMSRSSLTIITRRYTVKLACCAIVMKDTRYKELNSAFMKQYSDIFFKELPSKLPLEGGPKHRILLKDNRSINDRLMRVSTRY
ncbi:MAG: hypothetical protein E6J34_20635, partial [Chloroflexi bacterium]